MKEKVSQNEFRKYYLSEFELYDGEAFITFNIVSINTEKREIVVAVTDRGKISVITYDLLTDKNGKLYFEYGCLLYCWFRSLYHRLIRIRPRKHICLYRSFP